MKCKVVRQSDSCKSREKSVEELARSRSKLPPSIAPTN